MTTRWWQVRGKVLTMEHGTWNKQKCSESLTMKGQAKIVTEINPRKIGSLVLT